MDIGERQKLILASIVEQYISSGEPVGSKTLCETLPINVSSATVRNEMSNLTEKGLLEQRHTSGGRVPSKLAYRYYVDNLMELEPVSQWEINRINKALSVNAGDRERLLADAAKLLSDMTECVAFYTNSIDSADFIQGVELIPTGSRKAMLVMLTASGIIKSAICRTDGDIDEKFRETFYKVVKEEFVGTPLSQVSKATIQGMAKSLGDMIFPMVNVLTTLCVLCEEAGQSEIFVSGETNLLAHDELGENVYPLLSFLAGKQQLKNLLIDRLYVGSKFEILIGEESGQYELLNSTMVLSKYSYGARQGGVIGILGSTRINYQKLLPKFEYIATLVDKLLSERGTV